MCKTTLNKVRNLTNNVKEAVSDAIEEKALTNGHLTADRVKDMFESYHGKVITVINEQVSKLNVHSKNEKNDSDETEKEIMTIDGYVETNNDESTPHRLYNHNGRFWHVPNQFLLPHVNLLSSR